jgi:hypothetical protein
MKPWSQIFFLDNREGSGPNGELEMIVYGGVNDSDELVITKIETLNGETVELTEEESQLAKDCLDDSIYNWTGYGPKYFDD